MGIESQLGSSSSTQVIADLAADTNHPFIPMAKVPNLSQLRQSIVKKGSNRLEDVPVPDSPLSQSGRLAEKMNELAGKKSLDDYGPPVTEYYRQPRFACGQL